VSWYEPAKTWIMTLAVKDKVFFYSSADLKNWRLNSEFGHDAGAHGGVWECPDLFAIDYQGRAVWVLIVNINPGGPNGGSATQYFLGDFDGKKFTTGTPRTGPIASTAGARWLDYGPDEYAGVTWSNTGTRKIFLGWMSNWLYGQAVPTSPWRSATTLPRQLGLQRVKDSIYLTEQPVNELAKITTPLFNNLHITTPLKLDLSTGNTQSFAITFSNDSGENTILGYDKEANQYYIDRSHSGRVDLKRLCGQIHRSAHRRFRENHPDHLCRCLVLRALCRWRPDHNDRARLPFPALYKSGNPLAQWLPAAVL
jgi:fructan beta-fructosidase